MNKDDNNEIKKKRVRRTKKTVENLLIDSAAKLIEKYGFKDITVSKIIQTANVEPAVFYNRYESLDDFLDKFVRKFDYWLSDSLTFDFTNTTPRENVEILLISIVDAIAENKIMQQLLAWELIDNNHITQRTADNRERNSRQMMEYFNNAFKDADFNFAALANLITSGIYFTILHSNHNECKISKIDFSTKEGLNILKETVRTIIRKVFDSNTADETNNSGLNVKIECAKSLIQNGVSTQIIKEATGLSDETLLVLMNQ